MEKPPVVVRLMDQMKRMAELQQTFESAGKLMSKADKVKIMNVEKNKLDALKQEQLQEEKLAGELLSPPHLHARQGVTTSTSRARSSDLTPTSWSTASTPTSRPAERQCARASCRASSLETCRTTPRRA